jgi:hypothetical protein
LTVDFSETVFLPTLSKTDLLIDVTSASTGVTVVDGDTAIFDLPPLGDGQHIVTISAGSVQDLQGEPIQPFELSFSIGPHNLGYNCNTGEIFLGVRSGHELISLRIDSAGSIFTREPAQNLGGPLDEDRDGLIFKASADKFGSLSFGNVAQRGLSREFILGDLTVDGALFGGGRVNDDNVDRAYISCHPLEAGDADRNFQFDENDIIQVLQAGAFPRSPATWDTGDWNATSVGNVENPAQGDGKFDDTDLAWALNTGNYLAGPYAEDSRPSELPPEIRAGGTRGDRQTSIIYNALTGQISIDPPAGAQLTSIHIASEAGIFTRSPANNVLNGSFDDLRVLAALVLATSPSETFRKPSCSRICTSMGPSAETAAWATSIWCMLPPLSQMSLSLTMRLWKPRTLAREIGPSKN